MTTHADRADRVAAVARNYPAREAAEADLARARARATEADLERYAAADAVQALSDSDPQTRIALARFWAERARWEAATASVAMAEVMCQKLRASAEASAWDVEINTITQGNPHTPHTPQNEAWAQGYADARRGRDSLYSRPEFARATFGDCAPHYRDGYEASTQRSATAQSGPTAKTAYLVAVDGRAEALKSRVEAILGDEFTVAVNPHSDFPSVEIDTVLGSAIEYVGFDPETGKYQATQWVVGPYGEGREDTAFETLTEAVEHARKGTTREE